MCLKTGSQWSTELLYCEPELMAHPVAHQIKQHKEKHRRPESTQSRRRLRTRQQIYSHHHRKHGDTRNHCAYHDGTAVHALSPDKTHTLTHGEPVRMQCVNPYQLLVAFA